MKGSRPQRWRRARPFLVAAGASVALHALVGAGLWLGRAPAERRPRRPVEFAMVELRSVAPPAVPEPTSPSGPARAAPGRSEPARPGHRGAIALPGGDSRAASAAEADVAGEFAWATPAGGERRPADLSARPPPETVALHAPVELGPKERLDRMLREDRSRHDVALGLVDPFFRDLGRALAAAWRPETAVGDQGLSGYARNLGRGVADSASTWAQEAARYGRTGSPVPADALPRDLRRMNAVPEGALGSDISRQMDVSRILAEQSRHRNFATVRIVQRADGRLVGVELVQSSVDSVVDAQALRDLRAAAERLPAPSPEALRGRSRVVSLWEFELDVSISPPLPVVAVQFDEVLGMLDARVPLDRRIYKLVRLVAVD